MSGAINLLLYLWASFRLSAFVTVGTSTTLKGYSNGTPAAAFGSITPNPPQYIDGAGNTNTVLGLFWNSSDSRLTLSIQFSRPDTDATFLAIKVNGVRYTRASRNFTSNFGTHTQWQWTVADPIGATNPTALLVEL